MTRNKKALIIASSCIALLVGGYFGAKAYRTARFESLVKPREEIRLASLVSDDVVRIEASSSGLVLERQEGVWRRVPDDGFALDQEEINGLTWSLSNMRADKIIDEAPSSLDAYGLEPPRSRTIVTASSGESVEFFGGRLAPSRAGYYAMKKGDPRVYLVSTYPGERLFLTSGSVRDKKLPSFPAPDTVSRLAFQSQRDSQGASRGGYGFVIEAREGPSNFVMTSPYRTVRQVDMDRFEAFMTFFRELRIRDFVEDTPSSLAAYGLDKPVRIFIEGPEASLDILFGRAEAQTQYAKLAGKPGVFSVNILEPALAALPSELVSPFALRMETPDIDSFSVRGEGKTLKAEITRTDGEAEYFLDGKKISPGSFVSLFEACAGLTTDAEIPGRPLRAPAAEIFIEYALSPASGGGKQGFGLAPYNRDFYSLVFDGYAEFLVARRQVRGIFEAAQKVEEIE
jgi:hypothetical protein